MLQGSGYIGGILAGFENGSTASSNCSYQGRDTEIDGKVVGPDNISDTASISLAALASVPNDQDCPQRIFTDSWAQKLIGKRDVWCLLILNPFLQVLRDEDNIVQTPVYFREMGFESAFAQILFAGLKKSSFIVLDSVFCNLDQPGSFIIQRAQCLPPVKLSQLGQTKVNRLGLVRVESVPDASGNGWYSVDRCIFQFCGKRRHRGEILSHVRRVPGRNTKGYIESEQGDSTSIAILVGEGKARQGKASQARQGRACKPRQSGNPRICQCASAIHYRVPSHGRLNAYGNS